MNLEKFMPSLFVVVCTKSLHFAGKNREHIGNTNAIGFWQCSPSMPSTFWQLELYLLWSVLTLAGQCAAGAVEPKPQQLRNHSLLSQWQTWARPLSSAQLKPLLTMKTKKKQNRPTLQLTMLSILWQANNGDKEDPDIFAPDQKNWQRKSFSNE